MSKNILNLSPYILLIIKLVSTLKNVSRTAVWRICILMISHKRLTGLRKVFQGVGGNSIQQYVQKVLTIVLNKSNNLC